MSVGESGTVTPTQSPVASATLDADAVAALLDAIGVASTVLLLKETRKLVVRLSQSRHRYQSCTPEDIALYDHEGDGEDGGEQGSCLAQSLEMAAPREVAMLRPNTHSRALLELVSGVANDDLARLKSLQHFGFERIAVTDIDGSAPCSTILDGEDAPSVVAAENGAGGSL